MQKIKMKTKGDNIMTKKRFPKLKATQLESRVAKVNVSVDSTGEYIPYCTFFCHRGVILNESVCKDRDCKHYKKAYVEKW